MEDLHIVIQIVQQHLLEKITYLSKKTIYKSCLNINNFYFIYVLLSYDTPSLINNYSSCFRADNMKIRLPELVRQFSAEVLGTFLLVLFGDGAIAQVVLG